MNLNEEQKNKAESLKDFLQKSEIDSNLPIYEALCALAEHVRKMSEREVPKMEMPEVQKIEIEGVSVVTLKGDKGDKGDEPSEERLVEIIKPLIPEPIPGQKGDKGDTVVGPPGRDGKDGESIVGPQGEPGKDGSPDTPEQIREKLASLEDDKRLDISAIKGVEDLEKKIISQVPRGGGGVSAIAVAAAFKYIFKTEEPVGAIDGVNLTYTVSSPIWVIIGFYINGEQIAQLPNYTFANRTITFSTALPAALSGTDFEVKYIAG